MVYLISHKFFSCVTSEKNKTIKQIKNRFDSEIYILQEEQSSLDISYNNLNVIEDFDDLFFKALRKKIAEESYGSFEPYYLQLSQAERNLNDKSNN